MTLIDPMAIFCLLFMIVIATFTIKQNTLGLTCCTIVVLILNFAAPIPASFIDGITVFTAFSILFAILTYLCEKYEKGSKKGSYKKYAKMGLVFDEGVVIGQYDTILSSIVTLLSKILPADKKAAVCNWFVERRMNPMPLYLRDNSNAHILIEGESYYRRSDRFIIPTLLDGWKSSVIVHDIKGAYWEATAGYRKRIGNTVIKFEPTATDDTSACWNPLDEIPMGTPDERFVTDTLSSALVRMGKTSRSDFTDKAASVLTEIILHLKYEYLAYSQTLSLYDVATYIKDNTIGMVDEDGKPVYAWLSFDFDDWVMRDSPSDAPMEKKEKVQKVTGHKLHEIVSIPEDDGHCILSLINAALKDYLDPVLARNTAASDFCIDDVINHTKPVSLYLVTPPQALGSPSSVFRIFVEMLGIFGGDKVKRGYRRRCLVLMDECASLGYLKIFSSGLPHIALYGMKVVLFATLLQMSEFYGLNTEIQVICVEGKTDECGIFKDDQIIDVIGVKYQESHHFLSRMYEAPPGKSDLIHGNST